MHTTNPRQPNRHPITFFPQSSAHNKKTTSILNNCPRKHRNKTQKHSRRKGSRQVWKPQLPTGTSSNDQYLRIHWPQRHLTTTEQESHNDPLEKNAIRRRRKRENDFRFFSRSSLHLYYFLAHLALTCQVGTRFNVLSRLNKTEWTCDIVNRRRLSTKTTKRSTWPLRRSRKINCAKSPDCSSLPRRRRPVVKHGSRVSERWNRTWPP